MTLDLTFEQEVYAIACEIPLMSPVVLTVRDSGEPGGLRHIRGRLNAVHEQYGYRRYDLAGITLVNFLPDGGPVFQRHEASDICWIREDMTHLGVTEK